MAVMAVPTVGRSSRADQSSDWTGVQRHDHYTAAMSGYGQFCPVAVASEVLAQRWTPLVLSELLAGSSQFNEIRRGLPLMPTSTLVQRLRTLERAGVLTRKCLGDGRPTLDHLTAAGERFRPVIEKLGEWGQQSAARFEPQNLDAGLLMWNLRRRLAAGRLPAERVIVRFEFTGVPARYRRARVFWLSIERPDVELCLSDPGAEVDLYVGADLESFARVWMGARRVGDELRAGRIRLQGPQRLVGSFPSWLLLSHFAQDSKPAS